MNKYLVVGGTLDGNWLTYSGEAVKELPREPYYTLRTVIVQKNNSIAKSYIYTPENVSNQQALQRLLTGYLNI